MAYTSDYEICNLALAKIGQGAITSAQFTSPGTNTAATLCVAFYSHERDMLLESYPWKFAIRRLFYDVDDYDNSTITTITAAEPPLLTSTAHGLPDGYEHGVYLWETGVVGYDNEIFAIDYNDANSFYLYKQDGSTAIDGATIGAASTGYWRMAPLTEYDYLFSLPSDIIRIHRIVGCITGYERNSSYLLTNDDTISLEYIASITTVSLFPSVFVDALATKIGAEIAYSLAKKPEEKEKLLERLYKIIIPHAYRTEAIDDIPVAGYERYPKTKLTSWQSAGRR